MADARRLRSAAMRPHWLGRGAASALAATAIVGATGCSSTAFFDAALAKGVEARLHTAGKVHCKHQVRDLWLCTYEPDVASNSYAEVIVKRGAGDCWSARRGRPGMPPDRPHPGHGFSFGSHEAVGPTFRGCT
jgi:hypothetical protein